MTPPTHHPRPQAGFSLMEVLVALAIFALGFVAVAAIFPSAALMQRGTADDIQARHTQRNAEAMIKGMASSGNDLEDALEDGYDADETVVKPFEPQWLNGPTSLWSLDTRSFPIYLTNPAERNTYWVPLRRDANPDDTEREWRIYVFVLNRQSGNYVRNGAADEWANFDDGFVAQDADGPGEPPVDTWAVPGVRRMEIVIDENGDDHFTFADADINDDTIRPNPSDLLGPTDPLIYGRNGQVFRVARIDNDGRVFVNGTFTTETGVTEHVWIVYGGRDTNDPPNGNINSYHRPVKRIFTLAIRDDD